MSPAPITTNPISRIQTTLRSRLDQAKPLYILPREDIVDSVLVPAFEVSDSVDCMMGFFSSHSLAEIAPGLATYLARNGKPMRLIVSPYLSLEDQAAIRAGLKLDEEVAADLIISLLPDANDLASHTLACLSWLIKEKRISIRIALMRVGLFHTKAWIFRTTTDSAALHGSSNMTKAALKWKREQLTLSRSWKGEEPQYHIVKLQSEFESLWRGGDEDCRIIDLPKAVERQLLQNHLPDREPTPNEFLERRTPAPPGSVRHHIGPRRITQQRV